ncbi:MAG: 4-alpha-glucanotransferase, partial [Tidjanibacter sp.]|nr:4-alpha-glucanotransferase [Tidjanibacter sp.]
SYGDSPYQPLSSCAGNTYFIDLDKLVEDGLLTTDEIRCFNWGSDDTEIDYAILFENRKTAPKVHHNFQFASIILQS